jgi:hypothetical protein
MKTAGHTLPYRFPVVFDREASALPAILEHSKKALALYQKQERSAVIVFPKRRVKRINTISVLSSSTAEFVLVVILQFIY